MFNKRFNCFISEPKFETFQIKLESSDLVHNCDLCDYQTQDQEHLKKHIRNSHGDSKFFCKECDYFANNHSTLRNKNILIVFYKYIYKINDSKDWYFLTKLVCFNENTATGWLCKWRIGSFVLSPNVYGFFKGTMLMQSTKEYSIAVMNVTFLLWLRVL